MTDFFDWLTAADSGLGTDRLRERFRLSEAEMRRVTEALAPAFLLGLQRLSADPAAWADFMRGLNFLASGDAAGPMAAFQKDVLGRLFGVGPNPNSIARQASLLAGIAPGTVSDMMPELALMTIRTMMRMAGTPGAVPFSRALPGDAGGLAMAEMMRRSANAMEAFSKPSTPPNPMQNLPHSVYLESLFSDALKGGFPWMGLPGAKGMPTTSSQTPGHKAPSSASPFFAFAPLLDAFATPGAAQASETARGPSKAAPEAKRAASGSLDPVESMAQAMKAGRSLQETYAQEMLAFFDRHRRSD